MENKTKHWIFGESLHNELENLQFLYKSLVKNVKEHRGWSIQDKGSSSRGGKDTILLISSHSDLTPGFEGVALLANDCEPSPETDARVVRLASFFPDEFDYSQDIPLLPLRPDTSMLDGIIPAQGDQSILLLREPSENEGNRNILNALERLPESSSVSIDKGKETEITEALGRCCSSNLVISSVESPLCNQLFAEVVSMNKGRFHLFAQEKHSPLRFSDNHDQVIASGGRVLSLRSLIASLLKDLDQGMSEKTEITTSFPTGINIIEEIEDALARNDAHYFAVSHESFDRILSHPIEFQFSRDVEHPNAASTLHYLKHIKDLPGREETLRKSASFAHFFQMIGNALLTKDSDNLQIYGIVDLIRELPCFINHLKDYLSQCSPGSDLQKGIRLISLFRSAYSNYSFSEETEKLFDEFFTLAIDWLRKARSSEATICLGQTLSVREDHESLAHIFDSILKSDKKFSQSFLSLSLLYGVYSKKGSAIPPKEPTQLPQWLLKSEAMIEQLDEDGQVSNDLNYLRAKGGIWKSEESRIQPILENSDKRGGLNDDYLLDLMEDSILAGLSKTSDLLASKLQEKSKKMNTVKLVNLYSLLALHNASYPMPGIDFEEMTEKIPLCKRTFPDKTACALSITAKLAKDEKMSQEYRKLALKMGLIRAKRLDNFLKIADEVESQSICDWAEKVMDATGPRG